MFDLPLPIVEYTDQTVSVGSNAMITKGPQSSLLVVFGKSHHLCPHFNGNGRGIN